MEIRSRRQLRPKRKGEVILRPAHANAGIEADYARKLTALLVEMHNSVQYWLAAEFRKNESAVSILASDESAASAMRRMMSDLSKRWIGRFDDASKKLADYFATSVSKRSDAALKKILKDAGISIDWKPTAAQREILQSSVEENVALIRDLPAKYLLGVQNAVTRSVTTGRDLKQLSDDLQSQFKITEKRARFIAQHQNNSINAALTRARQLELNISEAIWRHSGGGKHPRPTHKKAGEDQTRYKISEGWEDPALGKKIWPGTEPNCFPASTRVKFAKGIKKAFRYWHDGELSCLVTDSGETLTATVNHPILTPNGWVSIGLLNEGDYIVHIPDDCIDSVVLKHDEDHAISCIGDIFDALAASGDTNISAGANFHGDIVKGDVDIVLATRRLAFSSKTGGAQCVDNLDLSSSNIPALGGRTSEKFAIGPLDAPNSIMGGLRETCAAFGANAVHPDFVGGTPASCRDVVSRQNCSYDNAGIGSAMPVGDRKFTFAANVSGDDGVFIDVGSSVRGNFPGVTMWDDNTPSAQVAADGAFAESNDSGNFPDGLPLGYKLLRVVNNGRVNFSGHVYTLETGTGWFTVTQQGIITKNCRCVSRSVVPGLRK